MEPTRRTELAVLAGRTGSEQHRRTAGLAANNIERHARLHGWRLGACRKKKKGVRSVTRVFGRHPATRHRHRHPTPDPRPHTESCRNCPSSLVFWQRAQLRTHHHGALLLLGIFLAFAAPGASARLCLVATNETFAATHKNM